MRVALTTKDNPFDPIDDFVKWWKFDTAILGRDTCGYLAKIARTSDLLTDEENEFEIERAIDEIIKFDPFNIYIKVKREENKSS
nr:MAG TPA: erythrocyte membrane protein 1 [Caudoviricetes sp.]